MFDSSSSISRNRHRVEAFFFFFFEDYENFTGVVQVVKDLLNVSLEVSFKLRTRVDCLKNKCLYQLSLSMFPFSSFLRITWLMLLAYLSSLFGMRECLPYSCLRYYWCVRLVEKKRWKEGGCSRVTVVTREGEWSVEGSKWGEGSLYGWGGLSPATWKENSGKKRVLVRMKGNWMRMMSRKVTGREMIPTVNEEG